MPSPRTARKQEPSSRARPARHADLAALLASLPLEPRVPLATYRLQFNPAFTFRDAAKVVPYLHALGITDCYASPYLKARPGSTHGYDICDHHSLNPDLGAPADFDQFVSVLQQFGMGQIMDVVPNHMGIGSINAAWMDVLENGEGSPFARFFDIDWHPLMAGDALAHKVLLPILGDPYGKVLENGELRLARENGSFYVYYQAHKMPIDPHTQTELLSTPVERLVAVLGSDSSLLHEYQSIITALSHLPPRTATGPGLVAERQREKEIVKRRLDTLCQSCPAVRAAIDQTVAAFNGVATDPHSFDRLDTLLGQQAYRVAWWRVAADEINYRRFFDINDLAAIRMEDPEIFRDTHQLVLQLLEAQKVTGLRIDHPDGLCDPAGYLRQLQRAYLLALVRRALVPNGLPSDGDSVALEGHLAALLDEIRPSTAAKVATTPLYIVVEKILSEGERLHKDWPVHGTTGYEFANAVNGLFVARANRQFFDNIYAAFIGTRPSFPALVNTFKKMIMLVSLASEINMLGYQLKRIAAKNRWSRDFTLNSLTFALREVIASLPVYRTYIADPRAEIDRQDRAYVEAAVADAKRRNPRTAAAVFDYLADILLRRHPANVAPEERELRARFVMKLQQTTGPVMAKGVEDTTFYVYNRLTSLNEVGGNPGQFGVTLTAFHRQNAERQQLLPHSMLCTSTHDTKRSEDVRARINVLSEIPHQWKEALDRWSALNLPKKQLVDGHPAPDPNEEYLLYQTLLGAWPFPPLDPPDRAAFVDRIAAYMEKATREAKVNTSWINPNEAHDSAVQAFVRAILDDSVANPFLDDFAALQRTVAHFGAFNALSQTVLKLTSPGVPDIYQGTELWDLSLVDPDNRRPVDFANRARLLDALQRQIAAAGGDLADLARRLLDAKEDGQVKLYLTHLALAYRREHADLFRRGAYTPLPVGGPQRDHVVAFARSFDSQAAVVIAPRLIVRLTGGVLTPPLGAATWADGWVDVPRALARRRYRHVFTGEVMESITREGRPTVPLAAVLASFPVAILEPVAGDAK